MEPIRPEEPGWCEANIWHFAEYANKPDSELLSLAAFNESARDTLVWQRYPQIFSVLRAMGLTADEACDVMSDVVRAGYRAVRRNNIRNFTSWMYQVAINRARTALRQRYRYQEVEERVQKSARGHDLSDLTAIHEFEQINYVLQRMSERYRLAFGLVRIAGLKNPEAAAAMGIRVQNTFDRLLSRACDMFEELYAEEVAKEWADSNPGRQEQLSHQTPRSTATSSSQPTFSPEHDGSSLGRKPARKKPTPPSNSARLTDWVGHFTSPVFSKITNLMGIPKQTTNKKRRPAQGSHGGQASPPTAHQDEGGAHEIH